MAANVWRWNPAYRRWLQGTLLLCMHFWVVSSRLTLLRLACIPSEVAKWNGDTLFSQHKTQKKYWTTGQKCSIWNLEVAKKSWLTSKLSLTKYILKLFLLTEKMQRSESAEREFLRLRANPHHCGCRQRCEDVKYPSRVCKGKYFGYSYFTWQLIDFTMFSVWQTRLPRAVCRKTFGKCACLWSLAGWWCISSTFLHSHSQESEGQDSTGRNLLYFQTILQRCRVWQTESGIEGCLLLM